MDDAALRDAARGVKTRVLPAGHDAQEAAGTRKLTKKVRGAAGSVSLAGIGNCAVQLC